MFAAHQKAYDSLEQQTKDDIKLQRTQEQVKEQERQKVIDKCLKNKNRIRIKTDSFRKKLGQGAGMLNQMVILNKAGDKIQQLIKADEITQKKLKN